MPSFRRIITAGGTFMCALGIGYFMQAGQSAPPSGGAVATLTSQPDAPVELRGIELTSATSQAPVASIVPKAPAPPAAPAALPPHPVTLAVAKDVPVERALPKEEATPDFACEQQMQARALPAAMVEISLSAPCFVNTRYTLHHNGMMFTAVTDDRGQSTVQVPALSETAVFIAAFGDGDGALATAEVNSLAGYDRYVVQWRGSGGLHLHAMEYGASFGDSGHVWAEARHDMERALRGTGGFLTRLGAEDLPQPLMAEIYTFPTGTATRAGDVRVQVEAQVNDANCNRDLDAQAIAVTSGGAPKAQDIRLAMPDCDGIGDYLVLKNLFNDLKIARN